MFLYKLSFRTAVNKSHIFREFLISELLIIGRYFKIKQFV